MNIVTPKKPRAPKLTDAEVAEIRSRKAAVRASLACEGMCLTEEEEALLEGLLQDRVTPDEGARRLVEWFRARHRQNATAT